MPTDNKPRCTWAGTTPLMQQYHDEEWGVPQHDSRMLWEMLMLEGFQAGLSWSIILKRREGFRKAFKNFDPAKVAKFTEADIERLMQDESIVRARAKIVATIEGAKIYQQMKKNNEDFSQWLWSFVDNKTIQNIGPLVAKTDLSETISKALRKRGFKFVGPVIVYAWMQACGLVNDHSETCFRRKAIAKA
jgi:DNA-3-methyladenine glycosylase I